MTSPAAAANRHVVDRCPSCGVEHEVRADACEACDTPLRPWCRAHSREIGWLESPSCRRCDQEAARRTRPPPPRPPVAPAKAPAKAVAPAKAKAKAKAKAAAPAKPSPRPDRARPAAVRAGGRRTAPLVVDEPLLPLRARVLKSVAVSTISAAAVGFAYGFGVEGEVTGLTVTSVIVFGLAGLVFGAGLGWGIVVDARSGRPRPPGSALRGVRR